MTCETLKLRIDRAGEVSGLQAEVGGMRNADPSIVHHWRQAAAVAAVVGLLIGIGAWVSTSDYESPPPLTRIQ